MTSCFPLSFCYRNGTTINCGENQTFCASLYTSGTKHVGVVTNCSLVRIWEISDTNYSRDNSILAEVFHGLSQSTQTCRNSTSVRPRPLPSTSFQIRYLPITPPSTLYSLIYHTIYTSSNISGMSIPVAVRSKVVGLRPLDCWDRWFVPLRAWLLVSCGCRHRRRGRYGQVAAAATGWSLVQGRPTVCVCVCV